MAETTYAESHVGMSGGMELPLQLRRESGEESKFDDIRALQEASIQVEFILPDDSKVSHEFKKGQTVQVLKSFLDEEYELCPADVQLFFRGKLMLDPFSLTDFQGVESAHSIEVSVRLDHHHDSKQRK